MTCQRASLSELCQEISALKTKLEGTGPEVVAKLREEREKMESRLRLANGRVNELENAAEGAKIKMARFDQDEMKVTCHCDSFTWISPLSGNTQRVARETWLVGVYYYNSIARPAYFRFALLLRW